MDSLRPAAIAAPADDKVVQIVRRLAHAFALSVTIALPTAYFALQYSNHVRHVEVSAQLKAEAITALVAANPVLWVYQLQRVEELLVRSPPRLVDDSATVRDATDNPLLTAGAPPPPPVLDRSFPIYDSGRVVGQVEITHSYRDVAFGTLIAALLGLLLGVAVNYIVLVLPLRALRRVSAALVRETAERTATALRYREVAETANDAIVTADGAGTLVDLNPAAERMFGYTKAEAIGQPLTLLMPQGHQGGHLSGMNQVLAGGGRRLIGKAVELHGLTKPGNEFPLELSLSEWETAEGKFITGIIRDITERKSQELRISRLNRTLTVLSGINSAIMHIRDRQKLFEEACRIAVEHGNFGMAWISEFDPVTLDVTPTAYWGTDTGEFATSKSTARADLPLGQGVVGRAIRAKDPVFVNDLAADPDVGSAKRREAIRRGYRSVIALPLFVERAVFGTFTLYTKEPDFFDEHELKLLRELAGDISFALEFIEQQHKIIRLSRIQAVLSSVNSAIVRIRDRQELLREACRIAVEHGQFGMAWIGLLDPAAEEVTPVAWAGFGSSEYLGGVRTPIREDLSTGRGMLARAIRTGKPIFENDITIEPQVGGARRQEAIRQGYRSFIVLPLIVEIRVVGSLSLLAKESGFFNEEEIKLLTELTGNISFALEHIAKQNQIEKLSRIRAVSSGINAAIVRIRDRQALFKEICRIAADEGRFEMIWIGTVDSAKQEVRPAAWKGFSDEAAQAVSWASISATQGMLGEAIRTRNTGVRNNIEIELPAGTLKREALDKGCHSAVCLPFVVDGSVVALAALFAAGTRFFDEDEVALLDEVADDASFALDYIAKEERLDYLAFYDALTGLPNRALFVDRTNQRMRARGGEQRMVALIFLDLTHLRIVNETLGRHAGDDLLRQVAARLKGTIEESDVLAHIGGDHFAIATRRAEQAEDIAHILEHTLTKVLGQPFEVGGNQLRLAARSGVAVYPADGADADELLKNAEAALNDAKKKGHQYLFYAPQMNVRVAGQLKLENELRIAVVEQQFVLHYQPRFDFATKQITGLEALVRWMHPERGIVSPGEFVPVLEETEMILEVGRWALSRAALDHAAWCAAGLRPPRIAVNVSSVQLRHTDFVDHVKDALAAVEKAADRIDIEITESMLMEDIEGSIEKLKAVRSMGLKVALDDFGTGYSSLNYLARLPLDSLKIDRSFVIHMPKGPEQMAIVAAVISLARALNLKVVAEGVETEEQANLLRLMRCDEAQGYLFGRPVPPEELEGMLRRA